MRAVCIIRDGPRYVPVFVIHDKTNKRHNFVWSAVYNAHIWDRGDLGPEDSRDLDNILSRADNFYRAYVILRPDDVTPPIVPSATEQVAEQPKPKNKGGRPRKVQVA